MIYPGSNPLQLFVNRLLSRSALAMREQEAILDLPTQPIDFLARRDIVKIDEDTDYACLVASGMVARFGLTGDGVRQFTAFHIAGDMADLHTTVRPLGSGGLHALCDTTILRVPHRAIRTIATRFPAIAEAFWRDCIVDAAILMQWVLNVGRRDARTRVAHLLCEMASRCADDGEFRQHYAFPVTQEQLGDATALTAVHVNRTLKSLGDLVTVKHGSVQIHDWAALTRLGDFDAAYLVADTGPARQRRLLDVE